MRGRGHGADSTGKEQGGGLQAIIQSEHTPGRRKKTHTFIDRGCAEIPDAAVVDCRYPMVSGGTLQAHIASCDVTTGRHKVGAYTHRDTSIHPLVQP